jgi:hypothetical protein
MHDSKRNASDSVLTFFDKNINDNLTNTCQLKTRGEMFVGCCDQAHYRFLV